MPNFWWTDIPHRIFKTYFLRSMLIFGQKSYFLGPNILEIVYWKQFICIVCTYTHLKKEMQKNTCSTYIHFTYFYCKQKPSNSWTSLVNKKGILNAIQRSHTIFEKTIGWNRKWKICNLIGLKSKTETNM